MAGTVQGIAYIWKISDTPIGSGDAGEVYSVIRQDQPDLVGVMKKPAKIATGGTIQRQAGQIAQEARALSLLNGLPNGKAHPPRLLDQAPEFTRGTANYFMISEIAAGEALSVMLAETLKSGKLFPQRVIIAVLDALFDMFSRAHKAGVLWNDVKLEHIYWENTSGSIGVIDWGNAIFINHQEQGTDPRWQDYQQIIDTLGAFLETAAPNLFIDLDWGAFKDKTLNATLVSSLARRISYQQEVIAQQIMENQALIRLVLNERPLLEGLKRIRVYQQNLNIIGVPWERDESLEYSNKLVRKALLDGDIQTTVSAIALVFEIFGEDLDLPWHLLREYCRHTDLLIHPTFNQLALQTLHKRWEALYNTVQEITNREQKSKVIQIIENFTQTKAQNY